MKGPAPADPRREQYERLVERLKSTSGVADRTPSPQLGGLTVGFAYEWMKGALEWE